MDSRIIELFEDKTIVKKIQKKLPELFYIAELERQRAGKIGMEVGSIRERVLVSLLIYYFGENNVVSDLPITEPESDVIVYDTPISIKTKTGSGFSGVKLIWTVDAENAREFAENYSPTCDMLFTQIVWQSVGYLYYFPLNVQSDILNSIGRDNYIKLPKAGTNPRGVELRSIALKNLIGHKETLKIKINWIRKEIEFNVFKRWIELWEKD